MSDFFFDTPYWFLGLLLVVAVALWISGNARQETRLKTAALIAFVIAVCLFLLSYFVDTDKEKVQKRTRQVIEAVEKKDKTTLNALLHPNATMLWMTKSDIVDKVGSAVDEYHLSNIRINALDTDQPAKNQITAEVSVTAHVETSGFGGDPPSTWQLVWERTGQGWQLREIRAVKLPGVDLNSIIGKWNR
jgi:hypothetical protein